MIKLSIGMRSTPLGGKKQMAASHCVVVPLPNTDFDATESGKVPPLRSEDLVRGESFEKPLQPPHAAGRDEGRPPGERPIQHRGER